MARKKKNKYPKHIRRDKGVHQKRLGVPFDTMSDDAIVSYFLNSHAFLRSFMNKTKTSYEKSVTLIWEVLLDVQKEDFAEFVRVCLEAHKDPSEDRRGFFNSIIVYLQDEARLYFQKQMEEQLSETIPIPKEWFFPKLSFFVNPHNYLYDFSIDFFLNNSGETELRRKYKLNRQSYFKMLHSIRDAGLTPVPLSG